MSNKEFVHLHLHTDHSLLDAAIQIKPLAKHLAENNFPACAITDHGNMYGAISFYNTMKAHDIKPIIGCEVYITQGDRRDRSTSHLKAGDKVNNHMVLLAKNYEGYQNLVKLTSKAFTEGFYYKPRIDKELLAQYSKGLIGLSACLSGVPTSLLLRGQVEEAKTSVDEFVQILGQGNYFLELQNHGLEPQLRVNPMLVDLAKEMNVPLVATNDAHYLKPDDARAHELLLCIGSGKTMHDPNRLRYGSDKFYVRSPEEMWNLFGDEHPEALRNTLAIADMCDLKLPKGINHVPNYPIPKSCAELTIDEYFERVVREGYEERRRLVWDAQLETGDLRHSLGVYQERISTELAMIKRMGFASYFLIVWDIVRYAREHNIPVGPGRGSAAGSLIAYCLGITDVDPIQYELLFERFLNPERVSMPDIDIDFCVRGRAAVIEHVAELYGRESVCQIITFGTMASKAAIKDVGRALNIQYGEVEKIAKLIPPPVRGRNVHIAQALEQVPELRRMCEQNPQVAEVIDLAQRLEGCARHASVHAAGVVISPSKLDDLIPIAMSSKSELTTQYAMSDLEKTGMLKMDFLALTTLTIISDCLLSIKQKLNHDIDFATIPLDDKEAMQLFADGRTEAIFQFESSGMQEICRRLKPKGIEDLATLNALYRPGPLDGGMVDDFIQRHHGTKSARYILPEMKDILSNTHGIIVYQEQIMQLAQKLAGFTLAEADLMRRAMGKKNREEMARQQEKFIEGATKRNIKLEKAEQTFNLMAQFADYGFNRSHSVAYAYLAFQTAYLKAHYPEHFYAAVLTNEIDDTSKILKYTKELRARGIALLPPDVNCSDLGFTPEKGAIRFGLAAIKGVGQASVEAILEARRDMFFSSPFDFAERVDEKALNKRVLESLVKSGSFDSLRPKECRLHVWRASLVQMTESIAAYGQRFKRSASCGQNDLFGGVAQESDTASLTVAMTDEWSHLNLLLSEKETLGFYITGHPLENYSAIIAEIGCCEDLQAMPDEEGKAVTLAGIISQSQVRVTKKGDKFAIMSLEDHTGNLKCLVWSNVYGRHQALCVEGEAVLASGRFESQDGGERSFVVDGLIKLDEALARRAKSVLVQLPKTNLAEMIEPLFSTLNSHQGDCQVVFEVNLEPDVVVAIKLNPSLGVEGRPGLKDRLVNHGCQVKWMVSP